MMKLRLWGVGIFSVALLAIFRLVFGFCHEKLHFSCFKRDLSFYSVQFSNSAKKVVFFYVVHDVVLFFSPFWYLISSF